MFGRLAKQIATARQLVGSVQQRQQAARQPAPRDVDVAVLFALQLEAAPLQRALTDRCPGRAGSLPVQAGKLRGLSCVTAVGGVGGDKAAKATAALLEHVAPRVLVCAGLAGALRPELRTADVLCVEAVEDAESGRRLELQVPQPWTAALGEVNRGALVTVPRPVTQQSDREQAATLHRAEICDMETFAVAEQCQQQRQPLLCLRVVCDQLDTPLPADLSILLQQRTAAAKLGAVTGAIFNKPGRVMDLFQLRQMAQRAAAALAEVLQRAAAAV